jgi:hypothetical protein
MSLARYFLDIEDRVPAASLAVLERGAIVNGAQADVNTVTVVEPHQFATSDKFLYAEDRTNVLNAPFRVFTVSGTTDTTVIFSGVPFTFPDGALLVNVGADTGGAQNSDGSWQKLNWDAAALTVYKDPGGVDAWTNSLVTVDPGGEVGFWANEGPVWGVTVDSGDLALRVYPDLGATSSYLIVTSVPDLPTASATFRGMWAYIKAGAGAEDQWRTCMKGSDDAYTWVPAVMGGGGL